MAEKAKARKAQQPTPAWKVGVLLGGLALLFGGAFLLYVGVKPLAPIMDLFTGGGQAPSEEQQEFLNDLESHMANAALPAGAGTVALLAGFVMVKVGMSGPKPKTTQQIVEEEVARRLAGVASGGAALAPIDAMLVAPAAPVAGVAAVAPGPVPGLAGSAGAPPLAPVPPVAGVQMGAARPAVVEVARPAGRRTHCACGSVLVAGGRICPQGHPQG